MKTNQYQRVENINSAAKIDLNNFDFERAKNIKKFCKNHPKAVIDKIYNAEAQPIMTIIYHLKIDE